MAADVNARGKIAQFHHVPAGAKFVRSAFFRNRKERSAAGTGGVGRGGLENGKKRRRSVMQESGEINRVRGLECALIRI